MISNLFFVLGLIALICIVGFIVWNIKTQRLKLLNKLYIALASCYGIWILALLIMKFVEGTDTPTLFVLDAVTNTTGPFTPALYLCISLAFLYDWDKMPRKAWLLFVLPTFSSLIAWTNPLHHLQYQVFSVVKDEVVLGPFAWVSGTYHYICLVASFALMINFAIHNRTKMYVMQCVTVSLGALCPLVVSIAATLSTALPITATPMSFMVSIVLNGIAIYKMHFFDIRPMATQLVLNSISDAFLILGEEWLVVGYNLPFTKMFSENSGIKEGVYLDDIKEKEESVSGTGSSNSFIYDIITAADSCKSSLSTIFYEQSILVQEKGDAVKKYYIVEVSPVVMNEKFAGCVILFKDVTQLKNSMQELQESQARMMEQERLAFLGQMIGGLAHNLKTPIMSISGCVSSIGALVEESRESLDDPQVTKQDYREIYGEIDDWIQKIQESTSYMSEVITAIKGQATTVVSPAEAEFTVDELFKRVTLLMRHELYNSQNTLKIEYGDERGTIIKGDINGLIQVLDNFISNAVYVQYGKGKIVLGAFRDESNLNIYVKDNGPGVSEQIKTRLFREMVTNKGTRGSGLGLYISQAIVHGNFGGSLWQEDNPEGGAIFGMSIPLERIVVKEGEVGGVQNEKKENGIQTE